MNHLRIRQVLIAGILLAAACWPGAAYGAPSTHIFDAALSLTGGCTVSAVDSIPDPGCEPLVADHPPASFSGPRAITTDLYGNIFVTSYGNSGAGGEEGRIDVFDADGDFISEMQAEGPLQIAVDKDGNLYVFEKTLAAPGRLSRFSPTVYNPAAGEIQYGNPSVLIKDNFLVSVGALALNPSDAHLFVHEGNHLSEFSSAAEGSKVIDESIGGSTLTAQAGVSVAVDSTHDRLYASDFDSASAEGLVRILTLSSPHTLVKTIDGSEIPTKQFDGQPSIAADEGTGNFYVYDGGAGASHKVYEFGPDGTYLSRTIDYGIEDIGGVVKSWVDNGPNSPNGALNPIGRYLFVPSHPTGVGHMLAYAPVEKCPPVVESAAPGEVSRRDAELRATIDPCNATTTYTFQITTQQQFEVEGFDGAMVAGSGQIQEEGTKSAALASASGLSPETAYVFRVVATNELGGDEGEGSFTTYPEADPIVPCPNDAVRAGLSRQLPDCRAYELVTPADTNARSPYGLPYEGFFFSSLQASPSGNRVTFQIEGGTIPGTEGTGSLNGDPYLSTRTPTGWSTASGGPTGAEAEVMLPGSASPDQRHSFWSTGVQGSAVIGGKETSYVRYPDGHSELIGRGSLKDDPRAEGKLISEDGGHTIFLSGKTGFPPVKLEPSAPPNGTRAIYDRTADEVTHVVSLLPGNLTPPAGQDPIFRGASLDGRGVAFTIGDRLYLRYDNAETYEVGTGITFAGVAEGGSRIFYLEGGKLIRFDALTGNRTEFNSTGIAIPVNVSADGSAAYLVSTSVLTVKVNPNGDKAKAGEQNLYLSEEGAISFVGSVTKEDMDNEGAGGLGSWIAALASGRFAIDPSRVTPGGDALLFESRAALDGYDPEGHPQVYLYDANGGNLSCLSCNPTNMAASGTGSLQSIGRARGARPPLNFFSRLANIRADGRRAFFQSTEALVPEDTDGLQDVYEWEDGGIGTCTQPDGCVYIVSSGASQRIDYLYAISEDGEDVFFRSSDLLVSADTDETPSLYDARVGGGFPESVVQSCEGEGCRPNLAIPPALPPPLTPSVREGNSRPSRKCLKGKRSTKRHGKARCVKIHRKHHHQSSMTKNGGRK
jgi:hypothetical protein